MDYFFVLGTNSALSVAEISAFFSFDHLKLISKDFLLVSSDREINAVSAINDLGGTVKIGIIKSRIPASDRINVKKEIMSLAKHKQSGLKSKFNFGFSEYGSNVIDKKSLGLELKKSFKNSGISARFVVSREKNLSSVIVDRNKLLTSGTEIIIASDGQEVSIGETLAVQPFKELSHRDYGRPARDDRSGMLPPKLAKIMLNLAQVTDKSGCILDPFCGSGTVLSEAALSGFRNLVGSDLSPKAIGDTKKNINWLKETENISDINLKLSVKNVLDLAKFVKKESVAAIITEPYLGPQRGHFSEDQVSKDLEELYSGALSAFYQVLGPDGTVVMVWPVFYGHKPIAPDYSGFDMVNMVPESLESSQYLKKNIRPTIIYGRPGQKVYREIVVLRKKRP